MPVFLARNVLLYTHCILYIVCRESDGESEPVPVYLARNVLLYTHYSGDVAEVVDTHFTKALNQTSFHENKGAFKP